MKKPELNNVSIQLLVVAENLFGCLTDALGWHIPEGPDCKCRKDANAAIDQYKRLIECGGTRDSEQCCDDVYWSDHWQCYYARYCDGRVEPLRDGFEAEQVARAWGISFTPNRGDSIPKEIRGDLKTALDWIADDVPEDAEGMALIVGPLRAKYDLHTEAKISQSNKSE